jgi:hypothetical protein
VNQTILIGRTVQIRGGMGEFAGRVGKVIAREGNRYRVRLLVPVNVIGVGEVKDSLFERRGFRLLTKALGHLGEPNLHRRPWS